MHIPILEDQKIKLEFPLGKVKPETIYNYFQDKEQAKFMTSVPYPYKLEDADNFLSFLESIKENNSMLEWGIFLKNSKTFIGMISLEEIDYDIRKAELGYWLAKNYWQQGYTYRAASLVLDYSFKTLNLQRIEAYIVKNNIGSMKLLEKLGFQQEGLLRRAALNKGKLVDRYIYSLLKKYNFDKI